MRTLHVLRHAKSDWSEADLPDHDRPLNERGRRASRLLAAHLTGRRFDLVVCSTAVRARQTLEPLEPDLDCPVRFSAEVYDASPGDLLAVVQALPDTVQSMLLVGHNPGVAVLTALLSDSAPSFPTGALATVELTVDDWVEAGPGTGRLTSFVTPRDLR